MSYQVLARKWRPRTFQELIGQGHIVQALTNAITKQRLHHAYLFTGTRGVGKTTIARVFAKTLSCHTGITASPCGACSACVDIDQGNYVDLVEVDAASRTRVEETRELLENVQYAPSQGRYKIYLIDEVHMFSGHSFNALLKTLEEPPPHVKFLLATTDPKKLPVTVLSRCLQFNLKHVQADVIATHLAHILRAEAITSDGASLHLIAKAAEGSVRDALSLLDQAIAFGAGDLRETDVRTWLGTLDRGHIDRLLLCIAKGDSAGLFAEVAHIAEFDPDYTAVLGEILEQLHEVALAFALGEGRPDRPYSLAPELLVALTPEDCQLYYQIALTGRRDLPFASDTRSGFEMVLLRMLAFRQQTGGSLGEAVVPPHSKQTTVIPKVRVAAPVAAVSSSPQVHRDETQTEPAATTEFDWQKVIDEMQLTGLARELALNCSLIRKTDEALVLAVAPSLGHLRSPSAEARLESLLRERYGAAFKLKLSLAEPDDAQPTPASMRLQAQEAELAAAKQSLDNDPAVHRLQEAFGASIQPDSIRPS